MKTEKEIRAALNELEEVVWRTPLKRRAFLSGKINSLKWVLGEEE